MNSLKSLIFATALLGTVSFARIGQLTRVIDRTQTVELYGEESIELALIHHPQSLEKLQIKNHLEGEVFKITSLKVMYSDAYMFDDLNGPGKDFCVKEIEAMGYFRSGESKRFKVFSESGERNKKCTELRYVYKEPVQETHPLKEAAKPSFRTNPGIAK